MTDTNLQHEHIVITDPKIVKMMSDPMRMRIAEALTSEARTAKELATVFDVPVTRLYYHIGLMEEHGMIQVVDTQMVSGIQEKRYQLIARNFSVDGHLFNEEPKPGRRVDEMIGAIFDNARRQLRLAIAEREAQKGTEATIVVGQNVLALTPAQLEKVEAELDALSDRFDPDRADLEEDAELYSLTFTLFPNVEAQTLAES